MAERLEIIITAKDNASKVIKNIGDISKGAFKVGLGVAAGGVVGLGAAFAGLLKGEMEMEAQMAELNAVIKSTGGVAGITAKEAEDLALAFQRTTRFSDDQVISAESMLLTFTQIGEDVFPLATEATLNLAEKFGSIDQASTMLGKALNDPIQGVAALRRVGIQLTEQQEEQIKSFMALGDIESAQKVILGELETQFGGLAEAMGDTNQGKITRFKNLLENAAGSMVALVIPVISKLLDKLLGVIPVIEGFGERIGRLIEVVTKFGLDSSQAAGMFMWAFGPEMGQTLYKIAGVIGQVIGVFKDLAGIILGFVKDHWPAFRAALIAIGAILAGAAVLGGILALVGAIAAIANPITAIIGAIALLALAWSEDWLGIRSTVTEAWNTYLKPVFDDVKAWLEETIPIAIDYLKARWEDTFKPALQDVADFVVDTLVPAFLDMVNWLQSLIPNAVSVAKAAWNGVFKPAIEGIVNFVIGTVLPALGDLLDWLEVSVPSGVNIAQGAWENTLKPALETVYNFVNDTLLPKLGNLAWWLTSTIGLAIDAAVTAWNDVFKPALEIVYNFVNDTLLPKLGNLAWFFTSTIGLAIDAGTAAWNDVLKPAFEAVYNFLNDTLMPKLGNLAWFFTSTIGLAIDAAKPFIEAVRDILDEVKEKAGLIPDAIDGFIEALGKVKVPQPIIDLYNYVVDIVNKLAEIGDSPVTVTPGGVVLPGQTIDPQTGNPVTPKYNALGGPVSRGVPYIVGERGPELFVPNAGGRIRPNHRLGAGNTFNLTVYSNATSEHIIRDFGVMKTWVGS